MMVFMPLVLVWIGQFCHDVIGLQNVEVVVIGQLFCCYTFDFLWLKRTKMTEISNIYCNNKLLWP